MFIIITLVQMGGCANRFGRVMCANPTDISSYIPIQRWERLGRLTRRVCDFLPTFEGTQALMFTAPMDSPHHSYGVDVMCAAGGHI